MTLPLRPLLAGTLLLALATPAAAAHAPGGGLPDAWTATRVADGSIRGQLVDATGKPIPGALVVLVDERGTRRGAALSDAEGRFTLPVRTAGRYRLRAERVGFVSTLSPAIDVADGQAVTYRMTARVQSVGLEGITISARTRCEVRPGEGTRTQVLWEEVRKALEGTAFSQEQGLFTFTLRRWRRELEPVSMRVENEEARTETLTGRTPFRSAPAAELRDLGWVRQDGNELVYFAPDAGTLLTDEFLDDHCFRVVPHAADTTRVGLAFDPVRDRRLPDVRGTLWVDRRSAELREMEFRYTGLKGEADDQRTGGRVQFERVPGGALVVRRWSIRMPLVREERIRIAQKAEEAAQRITAFVEEGGEVVQMRSRMGSMQVAGSGAVEGVVFDSTRTAPLANAQVFLSGTVHAVVTDTAGRFRLEGIAPGTYGLSYSHPRLDTLAYVPPPVNAQVAEGAAAQVALAVPSLSRLRIAACGDSTAGGVLFGLVRNAANGVPLPSARVTVSWNDPAASGGRRQAVRVTDGGGSYLFCSLPVGVPLQLAGEFVSRRLPGARLTLAAGTPREHRVDAELQQTIQVGGRSITASQAPSSEPVRVSGRLQRAEGAAPAGTVVRLRLQRATTANEPREVRTNARGEFSFGRVAPGEYRLEIVDPDRGVVTQPLSVAAGRSMEVEVRTGGGGTMTLAPINVRAAEAGQVRGGAVGRNRITRAQIEERMASARNIAGLLRRFPSLVITGGGDCIGMASGVTNFETRTQQTFEGPVEKQVVCHPMDVYVDDAPVVDGMGMLRSMSLQELESIEVLTPAEAGSRFPDGAPRGVILVYTRGNGPSVNRQQ